MIFRVTCSKGTYIRSLCADLGKALGRFVILFNQFVFSSCKHIYTFDLILRLDLSLILFSRINKEIILVADNAIAPYGLYVIVKLASCILMNQIVC